MALARIATLNSQSSVAISAAENAVAVAQKSEEAWALLIEILTRFKGRKAAFEASQKAPDTPTLMVLKANMLLQVGRGDDALELMRRAIALRPGQLSWKQQLADYLDKKSRGFRPKHNRK